MTVVWLQFPKICLSAFVLTTEFLDFSTVFCAIKLSDKGETKNIV